MTELNSVIVKIKLDCETQSVVLTTRSSFDIILVIADVITCPAPTPELGLIFKYIFILIVRFPFIYILVQSLFRVNIYIFPSKYLE